MESGDHDQPVRGRELWGACGQSEPVVPEIVYHAGVTRENGLRRFGDRVRRPAGGRRDDDLVAWPQLIDPVEGRAIGSAMAGDGGVARLARPSRADVVPGSPLQIVAVGPIDDILSYADFWDL